MCFKNAQECRVASAINKTRLYETLSQKTRTKPKKKVLGRPEILDTQQPQAEGPQKKWGESVCSSMVELLSSIHEVLGSILGIEK